MAFTTHTCEHVNEWRPNLKFRPTDKEPISPHPFTLDNHQYTYQLLNTFEGPIDNSPLQWVGDKLFNPFHPSYEPLRSVDEYKIATIALKVYNLISELDVQLDQWKETQPRISQAELEKIRVTIFRAHVDRHKLMDAGKWGKHLVMRDITDPPPSTHIISFCDADLGITRTDLDFQIGSNDREYEILPIPRVLAFLKPNEILLGKEHIAEAVRSPDKLETYQALDNEPPLTFLDAYITDIPEVYLNPWCPVLDRLCIIQIFLHRLIGLICKQFLCQQWRWAVDCLSPEDDAWHFLYWHNDCFQYLEPSFPTYLQGFHHRCMHVDSEASTMCTAIPPRNPLLTFNKDELLFHAISLFEFEGHTELANCIRYIRGAEPILPDQVCVLFKQGYVESLLYYDSEGRHHAFRGNEHDLEYYNKVD